MKTYVCTTLFTPDTPSDHKFDPERDLGPRLIKDFIENPLPAARESDSTVFFTPKGFIQHFDDGRVLQVIRSSPRRVSDFVAGAWLDMDSTSNNVGVMRTCVLDPDTGHVTECPSEHIEDWTWWNKWSHSETREVLCGLERTF